jgi:hypothetical protein
MISWRTTTNFVRAMAFQFDQLFIAIRPSAGRDAEENKS